MVSGRKGFYIWISDRSHVFNQALFYANNSIKMRKVFIRPYSVLFARGDVFHAGDKYDSSSGSDIRYHILITEEGKEVDNSIQYARRGTVQWKDPFSCSY